MQRQLESEVDWGQKVSAEIFSKSPFKFMTSADSRSQSINMEKENLCQIPQAELILRRILIIVTRYSPHSVI